MTPIKSEAGFFRGMAVLGAAMFTLGQSYRRYDWNTEEDERHTARTADGWNLALYRYRAIGEPHPLPVICSHGMAGSHFIFDLHPQYSLARHLAQNGQSGRPPNDRKSPPAGPGALRP